MMGWIQTGFDFFVNRPLLELGLMAIPLFLLARFGQRYPTRKLLLWFAGPAVISFSLIWVPIASWYLLGLNVALAAIALADLIRIPSPRNLSAERTLIRVASLNKPHSGEFTVTHRARRVCQVELKEDCPDGIEITPEVFPYQFNGPSRASFEYSMKCHQRGRYTLRYIHVRVRSPLGLWHAYARIPVSSPLHVYPDLKQIAEYELLARTNRLNLMGVRRTRRVGQDNEFERLRDYTQDDNYRFMDWRATARRRKLTVRDFQTNQSQRVMFLLDCGRMMTGESEQGTRVFDHALNAMLMLSYVALRQGDSVGLICFSDEIHNFTPARSGTRHLNRLLHATFNQQAKFVESRYDHAFLYLRQNCSKRSLVVLITNVIDEINAIQIQRHLGVLNRRHLPLAVLLRDHQLYGAIENPAVVSASIPTGSTAPDGAAPEGEPAVVPHADLFTAAAAAKIATWRHEVLVGLQHQGALTLDVYPEQLTAQLVNHYLQVKAQHLL